MDLRALRYFIAVAELQHFGRAAESLYVSQPSISYTIKGLEKELGLQLFARNARGAELTEAGKVMLAEARAIVRAADAALQTADRLRRGMQGRLRIGFEATGAGRVSTLARVELSRRFPDVELEIKRYDWGGETQALRDNAVDVSFIWLPADVSGLDISVVAVERRYCAMRGDHRLADREQISIMDLACEPISRGTKAPREWDDWWTVNPRPDGSEPVWSRTNDNIEELLEHVGEGATIGIVSASIAQMFARPGIAFVPITDIEPLRIAVGTRADEESPIVKEFVAIVEEIAADAQQSTALPRLSDDPSPDR